MDKMVSRQYFNEHASRWDETVRSNDADQLIALARLLPIRENARVLDVGTGTGVFIPHIKSKLNGGGRIVCVDFAFNMLEVAQKKNRDGVIDHVCAEIESVKFSEDQFDTVICYSTFPHFHDKPQALKNIFNILAAGGFMYICHSANREFINNIHRQIPDFVDHLIPERDEMYTLLKEAGFSEIGIQDGDSYYLVKATKSSSNNQIPRYS